MSHTSILIILLAFLTYGLLSQRLQSTALTGPMLFAGLGLVIGPMGADFFPFQVTSSIIQTLAEITLILVLFSDAAAIDFRQLRRDHNLPVRMLLIGMPLTIALTGLAAFVLLTDFTIWEALLLGAILAPTDAALGQADHFFPDTVSFVIILKDRNPEFFLVQFDDLGEKFPGQPDGLFLEVVSEREVAEHFKEGVVAGGVADVFQVVVLAAGPHATLGCDGPHIVALLFAHEHPFELDHAGIGEQQGGIILGDQGGVDLYGMGLLFEKF